MLKTKRTCREKLEKAKGVPKIVKIPKKMEKRLGKGKLLVPHPLEIEKIIQKVKKGKLITQEQIREKLAKKFKVNVTCPITTGIFVRICAEAAEEDKKKGKKNTAPYWRVIKRDGFLNEKLPGGTKNQAVKLRKEGYTVLVSKGKKPPKVKDFEKYL